MDLEIIILSKVSQRQISCDNPYMWNLKNSTNELNYKIETDSQTLQNKTKQTSITKGERGGEG